SMSVIDYIICYIIIIIIKNFIFGIYMFKSVGEICLLRFSLKLIIVCQKRPFNHLLGDCTGTFGTEAVKDVAEGRRAESPEIDRSVFIKTVVLDCENSINHMIRNIFYIDEFTFLSLIDSRDKFIIPVINLRRDGIPQFFITEGRCP